MRQSSSHRAASVLAAVLAEQGIRHAVVSPGSRNAPLVLALHLQPDIDVHVSIDERAAAHHALGMALATWTPVPVVCTSGTAALNHGPALAEAFHARVPLLSVTADRPPGVAGRGHGQTIHQTDIHRAHTVHRDVLDASVMNDEALVAAARQAIRASLHGGPGGSAGPVHLNVPFEEPLYELERDAPFERFRRGSNATNGITSKRSSARRSLGTRHRLGGCRTPSVRPLSTQIIQAGCGLAMLGGTRLERLRPPGDSWW